MRIGLSPDPRLLESELNPERELPSSPGSFHFQRNANGSKPHFHYLLKRDEAVATAGIAYPFRSRPMARRCCFPPDPSIAYNFQYLPRAIKIVRRVDVGEGIERTERRIDEGEVGDADGQAVEKGADLQRRRIFEPRAQPAGQRHRPQAEDGMHAAAGRGERDVVRSSERGREGRDDVMRKEGAVSREKPPVETLHVPRRR